VEVLQGSRTEQDRADSGSVVGGGRRRRSKPMVATQVGFDGGAGRGMRRRHTGGDAVKHTV
jgi:hypothetical protein